MNEKEYYVLRYNENQELFLKKGDCYCYPAANWTDAAEGVVTDIEIVETFKTESIFAYAYITGTMVPTSEFDFNSDLALKMKHLLVVGNTTLVLFEDSDNYSYYSAKLETGEIVPVSVSSGRYSPRAKKDCMKQLKQITAYIRETQGSYNKLDAMMVCINHFKELELHGADEISVYDDCIFFVNYPGWYRDGCTSFYITSNNEMKRTSLGSIFANTPQPESKTITFSAASLFSYMKSNNISAGEDSGHDIPNLPKEYRHLFSTKELKNGGVYVSLKAENFMPELLQNDTIMSFVDDPLDAWTVLKGAYCSLADFFD